MNGIAQSYLACRRICSGRTHISPDSDRRRVLEIKSAEDSNSIHGVENGRLGRIREGVGQIEAFDTRMKVRRIEANDFGILSCGLRQQVPISRDHDGDTHVRTERVPARSNDVTFYVNRVLVVRHDREDPYPIAILDFEGL